MGKIFCLMGKSSTGKDTIYKRLLGDQELGLQRIVPYTTRPIREGEQEGVEYHFVSEETLQRLEEEGRVVELRAYDTVCGALEIFYGVRGAHESGKRILCGYRYAGVLECHETVLRRSGDGSGLCGSGRRRKTFPCAGARAAAGNAPLYGTVQKIPGGHRRFLGGTSEGSRD